MRSGKTSRRAERASHPGSGKSADTAMRDDPRAEEPDDAAEENAYRDVPPEALILRDHLAADRTVLASERTFLAYLRTAFAFAVGGATLVHFIDRGWAAVAGWAMIPVGAALLGWGVHRFLQVRRRLAPLRRIAPRRAPVDPSRGGPA